MHGHGRDSHGNPRDLVAYIARMVSEDRSAWQRPEAVLAALRLRPGQTVADVGAGPGYFALRLARKVGPRGRVFAVEVDPSIAEVLCSRIKAARARNVTPVLGLDGDPLLPGHACDLVLAVNTLHHVQDRAAYLRRLARALKRGGRIAAIDFQKRELPVGPPVEHTVSREALLAAARAAGLRLAAEHGFLPYQYFFVFKASSRLR